MLVAPPGFCFIVDLWLTECYRPVKHLVNQNYENENGPPKAPERNSQRSSIRGQGGGSRSGQNSPGDQEIGPDKAGLGTKCPVKCGGELTSCSQDLVNNLQGKLYLRSHRAQPIVVPGGRSVEWIEHCRSSGRENLRGRGCWFKSSRSLPNFSGMGAEAGKPTVNRVSFARDNAP